MYEGTGSISKLELLKGAKRRLRYVLFGFSLAVALPLFLLIQHMFRELRTDTLFRLRTAAQESATGISRRFGEMLTLENSRSFDDYSFFSSAQNQLIQLKGITYSPLSEMPPKSNLPGIVGYFQIDPDLTFRSPVLPTIDLESFQDDFPRVGKEEMRRRLAVWNEMFVAVQEVFPVKEVGTKQVLAAKSLENLAVLQDDFGSQVALSELNSGAQPLTEFSEMEMLSLGRFSARELSQGRLMFVRQVERTRGRFTQGFLVDQSKFFLGLLGGYASPVGINGALKFRVEDSGRVIWTGIQSSTNQPLPQLVVYREKLWEPLSHFEVVVAVDQVEGGPGGRMITILGVVLAMVLFLGIVVIYFVASGYVELAQERSNFVSSVSHELRTPLTAIRMYGETLRAGWVQNEGQKNAYYDFITRESERLSRMIENLLYLGKLTGRKTASVITEFMPEEIASVVVETINGQQGASGFSLQVDLGGAGQVRVRTDRDALTQILLNLVENSIKFSKDATDKTIILGVREGNGRLVFYVRDFGPGIPIGEAARIFDLFYRVEDELTRSSPGTGIGLALVRELADKIGAGVSVEHKEPGVEFQVIFYEKEDKRSGALFVK